MTILRDLHTLDEYRQVVDLERAVWGYTDMNDVVTVPVFIITMKRGGILVGAFDEADRMVGFVFSLVGLKHGRPMHWSHMLGVLPEYRSSGLGRQLKLAQRERALAANVDLIEWTFDPMQALNAHLNFTRLGVVSDEYARNVYGESTSSLHRGTPTDRLIVQWNIREPHVERRLARDTEGAAAASALALRRDSPEPWPRRSAVPALQARAQEAAAAPVVNRTAESGPWLSIASMDLSIDERRVWLEIPGGFSEMQQRAPELALDWRLRTREAFETYLGRGHRVVDFALDRATRRGRYLLAK